MSLDYSAAFDTIDHSILLDRLKYSFGFTGTALTWLQYYLTGCSQFVKLGTITQQQYADNTQLYIALSPNDSCTSVVNLESCLNDLYYWCCLNGLAVNLDKTDSILLGTRQQAMVRSHIRCAALR